jgi:hypothetical protein
MGSSLSTDTDLGGEEKDLVLNRKEVSGWSNSDVLSWLEQNNFPQYKGTLIRTALTCKMHLKKKK